MTFFVNKFDVEKDIFNGLSAVFLSLDDLNGSEETCFVESPEEISVKNERVSD